MKQVINNLKNGEVSVVDTPPPKCCFEGVLIATKMSLVSPGTEKMLIDFGKSSFLTKALKNPERVQQVFNKARTDGFSATFESVKNKLDEPFQLGYCNSGVVIESRCKEFQVGDRVVSNGPHAEIVSVPKNLVSKISGQVSDEAAVFTVLGSIALHGVRLSKPLIGETFFVMGLGLVGLLTVQILKANGCNVICYDLNRDRVKLAESYGAIGIEFDISKEENKLSSVINKYTAGFGVDAIIIATSTLSNEPIKIASKICRKRGRVTLIGTAGLSLDRSDFYEKEIKFQVSCSYGPGRYDPSYELWGNDYPFAYVRWTEQRNFEAILQLMSDGKINTESLISHHFDISEASYAFDTLLNQNSTLGVLINYPHSQMVPSVEILSKGSKTEDKINVGWIGAGGYASKVLIPKFKKIGCNLEIITSDRGLSAAHNAKKFGFTEATNSNESIFKNKNVNTVVVTTRHNSHAECVISALDAGKHVYCEKPLCLNLDELQSIKKAKSRVPDLQMMIGFNRRFAPLVNFLNKELEGMNSTKTTIITVNAGHLNKDHWTQDPLIGGGRLIGEACHFIDLSIFLTQSEIVDYSISHTDQPEKRSPCDNFTISLKHADGSLCQIHYITTGAKNFPKERIEVFCAGKIYRIDNYLKFSFWDSTRKKTKNKLRQDKGQEMLIALFAKSLRDGCGQIIPIEQIYQSAEISILLNEMLNK